MTRVILACINGVCVRKFLFFSSLLVATLACAIPGAAPSSPDSAPQPMDMGVLNTAIAQTADASWALTATNLPTSTPTPTATFTPTITPTPTPTFIVPFRTATPLWIITEEASVVPIGTAGGSGGAQEQIKYTGKEWTCQPVGKYPPKGFVFKAGTPFVASWTIVNTGTKTWTVNGVDVVYTGGWRHEETRIQDFHANVPTGGRIKVTASFIAPKREGEYNSYFTLMVGKRRFCHLAISFGVVE